MGELLNCNHSVMLDKDKCIGCTDCIKRCPTEAIRVKNAKAVILDERCIDCGMCIRVCKSRAKKAITSPTSIIDKYPVKVVLTAPSLYAQFKETHDINTILTAVKNLGFDYVFEVSKAAEWVTMETKKLLKSEGVRKPLISSSCPGVLRLIMIRFPSLLPNILKIVSPMEAAAMAAKDYLVSQGIKREDIGAFFISPCSAKATSLKSPFGIEKSSVDGVISIEDIYVKLINEIKNIDAPEPLYQASLDGIYWAMSGGETRELDAINSINVDGIENVINVLELLENGQLEDVDFIEALACIGGCIGGPLTIENAFVARNNLKKIQINASKYKLKQIAKTYIDNENLDISYSKQVKPLDVISLNSDRAKALKMLEAQELIQSKLPNIDCGSCGAPTCSAHAEDIVKGFAKEEDCIFMLKEKIVKMAENMIAFSKSIPHPINESRE